MRRWTTQAMTGSLIAFLGLASTAGVRTSSMAYPKDWSPRWSLKKPSVPSSPDGPIERWVDGVLFYEALTWVFTVAYFAFTALVLITWIVVPPTRRVRKR